MLAHHPLSVLPFVALAFGGPLFGRNPQCTTGSAQCCQSVQSAGSVLGTTPSLADLGALLQGNVGLQCSSLTGAGSTVKCESHTVCCNDTTMSGAINFGCSPLNIDV